VKKRKTIRETTRKTEASVEEEEEAEKTKEEGPKTKLMNGNQLQNSED
jgi:hypothetical protein